MQRASCAEDHTRYIPARARKTRESIAVARIVRARERVEKTHCDAKRTSLAFFFLRFDSAISKPHLA
uniref:Uncharacterized protein n=1 Tax=Trichogramma kaykai TaxID=54128 RepID=A0ABD2VV05_9HYME